MGVMKVDESKCDKCGLCIQNCPFRAWEKNEEGYPLLKEVEDEELKEELEDMDKVIGQMVITDKYFSWWLSAGEGVFDYGEGQKDDPNFTMKANWETLGGVMSGDIDGNFAYMSGDLVIEGNLQDIMGYGEVMRVAIEAMQRLGRG